MCYSGKCLVRLSNFYKKSPAGLVTIPEKVQLAADHLQKSSAQQLTIYKKVQLSS